jgi:hypothetical protein
MRKLHLLLLLIFLLSVSALGQTVEASKVQETASLKDSQPQIEKLVENNLADALEAHAMDVYSQRVMGGTSTPSNPCPLLKVYTRTSNGDFYTCNNGSWRRVDAGVAVPGGSTTQVQYNLSNAFAGDSGLIYTGTGATGILTVGASVKVALTGKLLFGTGANALKYTDGVGFAFTDDVTSRTATFDAQSLTGNHKYTLLNQDGTLALTSQLVTNSAGANVVPKSNGTNLVASRISDDGTTINIDASLPYIHLDTTTDAQDFNVQIPTAGGIMNIEAANGGGITLNAVTDNIKAQTTGTFSAGDADSNANGTKLIIDDNAGEFLLGISSGGIANGQGFIYSGGVWNIGDAFGGGNGTKITVDDSAQTVSVDAGSAGEFDINVGAGGVAVTPNLLYVGGSIFYASTTPTISSGFGVSPSITGRASAFKVTVGTGGATSGVVAYNATFTNAPICIANDETSNVLVRCVSTTTGATISGVMASGDVVKILSLGY